MSHLVKGNSAGGEPPAESNDDERNSPHKGECSEQAHASSTPDGQPPEPAQDEELRGDSTRAIAFLGEFNPDGPWVLSAIDPASGRIETKPFLQGQEEDLRAWLVARDGKQNLYFQVNEAIEPRNKKASKEDMKAARWLHVDVDPRKDHDIPAEQARILKAFQEPPEGIPKPTLITFSGGGYQAFWQLKNPYLLEGNTDRAADFERFNKTLEQAFGGDNCRNVDRIMRLPYTVNLPNELKRKKGRTAALARVVEIHKDRVYPLGDFKQAPPRAASPKNLPTHPLEIGSVIPRLEALSRLDKWSVSDRIKALITVGNLRHIEGPKSGDDSRSGWLFDCLCGLARASVPPDVIYGIITDASWAISESVIDKGRTMDSYARRQIERAIAETVEPVATVSGQADAKEPPDNSLDNRLVSLAPVDRDKLPEREWIIDGVLMRRNVTMIVGRGGAGKSLLALQLAIAVTAGRSLGDWKPRVSSKVLLLNAEDDLDEQRRRLLSACEVMEVAEASVSGRLLTLALSNIVMTARNPENGKIEPTSLARQLTPLIRDHEIGVIVLDPFVETHAYLDENSNTDMREAITAIRQLARVSGVGVMIVHHTRKGAVGGDQDAARGGSALVNACRVVLTVEGMTNEEANRCLPAGEPQWRYLRVTGAKSNYGERGSDKWFRLESVALCNGGSPTGDYAPGLKYVQLQETEIDPGTWPHRAALLEMVRRGRENGLGWSASAKGPRDARLEAQVEREFGLSARQARSILDTFLECGLIAKREVKTRSRHSTIVYALTDQPQQGDILDGAENGPPF